MFWFIFIFIVLFILFLIVILISTTRTSTDKTLRNLKDELETKNKALEAKKAASQPDKQHVEQKVESKSTSIVVEPAVVEDIAVETVEEHVPAVEEEVAVEPTEPVTPEEPFIEEEPFEEPETIKEEISSPEPEVTEVVEEEAAVVEEPVVSEVPEEPVVVEEETAIEEPSAPEVPEETVPEEPVVEAVIEEETYDYPAFDNTRTMEEFGLPKEEADEFIVELIQQVDDELPGLEAAVAANENSKIEDISHMLKGSATNLGTGGLADVLIDFNTYMKTQSDPAVIAMHMRNLHRAYSELKEQFQK